MKQRLIQSFNLWVVVLVGMALFHTCRGSIADIVIFGVGASLILSQDFGIAPAAVGRLRPNFILNWDRC